MKNSMKTMGQLSVVLLICVLLGQGMWLNHVRKIKMEEFRKSANYVLLNTTSDSPQTHLIFLVY